MGEVLAGICDFDPLRYQRKEVESHEGWKRVDLLYAHEALKSSGADFESMDKNRIGIYVGITEHGNVETENEIHNIFTRLRHQILEPSPQSENGGQQPRWRGFAQSESDGTGLHDRSGLRGGNLGLIHAGVPMLQLGEVDFAIAGGVSESIHASGFSRASRAKGRWPSTKIRTKRLDHLTLPEMVSSLARVGPFLRSNDWTTL